VIIKGGSHSGRGLGSYLLGQKNERVEVWEVRGDLPRALPELLNDWRSDGRGSKCTKPLYHAQLNPDRKLSREEWDKAIAHFEREMGFQQQPRVAVLHQYKGREHLHLVYSRLDGGGKAIPDSWNYLHHEKAARAIEKDLGLDKTQGALYARKDSPRPERTPSRGTIQQGGRTKHDPKAVKAEVAALYQASGGHAHRFLSALQERGYSLAQGDRRGLVLVDAGGGVHSLTRMSGAKAGELRQMLGDGGNLPKVAQAKAEKPAPKIREPVTRQHSIFEDPVLKKHRKQIKAQGAVEQRGLVGKWHEQQAEWVRDIHQGFAGAWERRHTRDFNNDIER
jgi:hypothetical protein